MLANLLRRLILGQMLMGAGLGHLLFWLVGTTPWSALVGAVLMPFLGTLLLCCVTALRTKAHEPLVNWLRALWGEYAASVLVFLLRQPWASRRPRIVSATGSRPQVPVVLVHGYLCNHRIWDTVAKDLRAQGHMVLAVNLEPLFTSIDNYVPIIEAAVDELCQHTGAAQVALVGHSMGGLALRAWMRIHGTQRVARVLTLGTPHAGTQIEPRAYTPNGKEMAWQSPWLTALTASEGADVRERMRIAITPQDNIVYPQRAQVLPGVEVEVFEGIGHLQMCLYKPVREWIGTQLLGLQANPGTSTST